MSGVEERIFQESVEDLRKKAIRLIEDIWPSLRKEMEEQMAEFYSGMGGEIIPAVYKAAKVNPQSSLVSSFQNISVGIDRE